MPKRRRSHPLSSLLFSVQTFLAGDPPSCPDPPAPPPPGAAPALRAALCGISLCLRPVHTRRVPLDQRRSLGGLIVPRGAELVDRVVHALRHDPGAFPDQLPPDRLASWQASADAWRLARCTFRALADLADQNYVYAQAGAIHAARAVIDRVSFTSAHPDDFPQFDARRRWDALYPALIVAHQIRVACTPYVAPQKSAPRPTPTLSPRQQAARTPRGRAFRRQLDELFAWILSRPAAAAPGSDGVDDVYAGSAIPPAH